MKNCNSRKIYERENIKEKLATKNARRKESENFVHFSFFLQGKIF